MPRELTDRDLEVAVDPDLLDLVPMFLDARRAELLALEAAVAQGNHDVVHLVGHRIKGVAGMYGFHWLGALGLELEAMGASDPRHAARHVEALRDYLARVRYHAA